MKRSKFLLLLLPLLLTGCIGQKKHNPDSAYYYLTPNKDLMTIGRVVLLELANESAYTKVSFDITDSLYGALQKRQIFGITVIRQSDPSWQNLQLGKFDNYSLEQLSAMHKSLKADAVLRGTVTRYEPFPHLVIGLRLELIDLVDGQLLWGLEQIWDASDESTQNRVRDYYKTSILPGSDSLEVGMGTVSSLRFIDFITYETAKTIKPKR
ncbi:MAG: hypothetical protein A2Y12_11175 [Planctomycetes bacterium GWF2_42_9]|nr:MAG: hypothetical protein A2Y12_11175 [Planctomycetes bacterium GWF2_42_9]HAL45260.1 hypothetical protein [Phycisphaerales bacterium]